MITQGKALLLLHITVTFAEFLASTYVKDNEYRNEKRKLSN